MASPPLLQPLARWKRCQPDQHAHFIVEGTHAYLSFITREPVSKRVELYSLIILNYFP